LEVAQGFLSHQQPLASFLEARNASEHLLVHFGRDVLRGLDCVGDAP
jgi:hypothetical protein